MECFKNTKSLIFLLSNLLVLSSCRMYSTGKTSLGPNEQILVSTKNDSNIAVEITNYSRLMILAYELNDDSSRKELTVLPRHKVKVPIGEQDKVLIINQNSTDVQLKVSYLMLFKNSATTIRSARMTKYR